LQLLPGQQSPATCVGNTESRVSYEHFRRVSPPVVRGGVSSFGGIPASDLLSPPISIVAVRMPPDTRWASIDQYFPRNPFHNQSTFPLTLSVILYALYYARNIPYSGSFSMGVYSHSFMDAVPNASR
jgi:hypothetical protein